MGFLSDVAGLAGAGLGWAAGGPVGAMVGASLANSISGGGGGFGGLTGGVPSGPYSGNSWTPPNMTGAANQAYGNIGNLQVSPYAAPMAQAAYGQAGQTLGAGNQLYQTSLDPQQQLYNRMYGLTQNQSAANQASRGLAMSPVGAQMSNQAGQNFNMDWQNQMLARQAQGLQGMAAANASAGNLGNLALNYSNQPNLLNQQQTQDYLTYTGQGMQGAGSGINAFNSTAPYQQAAFGAIGQGLSSAYNGLSSAYSNWTNPYGSTTQQNASYMGDPTSTVQNLPGA